MTTLEPEQQDILEKLNEIALETNWGTVERVNGVPKPIAVIQEAMEEIKELRNAEDDLRIYEMQMKNGEIDMTVGSDNARAFIWSIIQIFKQNCAKNFFTTTVEVDDKHCERYALTIQKIGGESPAEQLSQMRQETARNILTDLKDRSIWFIGCAGCDKDHFDEQFEEMCRNYGVEIDNNE